ncbi:MAG: hypothetical protein AAB214_10710 [Fibrobacterota bacterium]|mgnify:CR=1 FL=1
MIAKTGSTFIVILIATFAGVGSSKDPAFSSIYTDESACKGFDPCEEEGEPCGGDGYSECQGPHGYFLYESYSAFSTMRDVQNRNIEHWQVQLSPTSGLQMQTYGQKTEWRLADGIPFAVIQRTRECDPDAPKNCLEFLLVRGLRGYESILSDVDAKKADANSSARSIANKTFLELYKTSTSRSKLPHPKAAK